MTWHVYLVFRSCYLVFGYVYFKLGWGLEERLQAPLSDKRSVRHMTQLPFSAASLLQPNIFQKISRVVEKSLSLPKKSKRSLEFLRDYLVTYDSLVLLLFQVTRTYFFLQKIPNKEFFLGRNIEWLDCVAEARKLFGICLNFDNFSQTVMRLIWSI